MACHRHFFPSGSKYVFTGFCQYPLPGETILVSSFLSLAIFIVFFVSISLGYSVGISSPQCVFYNKAKSLQAFEFVSRI